MNYQILVNKDNPYNKEEFSNINLVKIINELSKTNLIKKRTTKA